MKASARKNKVSLSADVDLTPISEKTKGYSSAELELVVLAALGVACDSDRSSVTQEDLAVAVGDVIPSRDTRMLSYMELLAVFESSSRRMLPPRFSDMSTAAVQDALDRLRTQLGRRVS